MSRPGWRTRFADLEKALERGRTRKRNRSISPTVPAACCRSSCRILSADRATRPRGPLDISAKPARRDLVTTTASRPARFAGVTPFKAGPANLGPVRRQDRRQFVRTARTYLAGAGARAKGAEALAEYRHHGTIHDHGRWRQVIPMIPGVTGAQTSVPWDGVWAVNRHRSRPAAPLNAADAG